MRTLQLGYREQDRTKKLCLTKNWNGYIGEEVDDRRIVICIVLWRYGGYVRDHTRTRESRCAIQSLRCMQVV